MHAVILVGSQSRGLECTPMTTLPLHLIDGHLFLVVENDLWLIDTGVTCPQDRYQSLS